MFPARFGKGVGWLQDLEAREACQRFEDMWAVGRRLAKQTVYLQLLKRFFAGFVLYIQLNERLQLLPIAVVLQTWHVRTIHIGLSQSVKYISGMKKAVKGQLGKAFSSWTGIATALTFFSATTAEKNGTGTKRTGFSAPDKLATTSSCETNRNSAQGSDTPSICSELHDVGTWSSRGIHLRKLLQKRLNF